MEQIFHDIRIGLITIAVLIAVITAPAAALLVLCRKEIKQLIRSILDDGKGG